MWTWTLVLIIFAAQPVTVTFPGYASSVDCVRAGAEAVNTSGATTEDRKHLSYACVTRPPHS
jgi:hypothetical protein